MLNLRAGPPDPYVVNYLTAPWLVTKFTSVSLDGELGNAGGLEVYFPNLAKNERGYWVDLDRVEWFPLLPYCTATLAEINLRTEPATSGAVIGALIAGRAITIREYLPQGSDVWGRIDEGWILLEYQVNGQPVFSTGWDMETRPPIVFD
jgi:hypothetical protein